MPSQLTLSDHSIAGAFSGFLTRFLLQPLDVLKIRFQLQVEPIHRKTKKSKYRGLYQAVRCIYVEEGFKAFWKGHVPAQGLSILYGTVKFATFEKTKETYLQLHNNEHAAHFICGGLGGCAATFCVQPFDMLRTRLVAQGEPKHYKGLFDATVKIMQKEGLTGFYKGLTPTLIQIAPYAGISFGSYKLFKDFFASLLPENKIGLSTNLVSGACAGIVAKTITYPLDVVKKRLQIQGFEDARKPFGAVRTYNGMFNCFRKMIMEEKLIGIYKGLAPSLLKAFFATSFHFAFYDETLKFLATVKKQL